MSVVIETTIGAVTVDLYTATRPKLCRNFLKLCKVKFYNFCLFHNVQPRFMAQTGDPGGTGRGGESVFRRLYGDQARFFDGDEDLPKIRHSRRGHISMVGAGDNLFGSQFLITLDDDLGHLDGDNRVFGEVVAVDDDGSLDVLDKFNEVIVDEEQRPFQDVRIAHTVVLDDPFDDPDGLEIPPGSPLPDPEMLKTDRLAADEDVEDDDGGATAEETAERAASKEARAQATILEMIGDLPEADCAPPENVLFVCKLNPVTSDDDLEIIFSRFGKVVNCEVIRDQKTNDSLQYAFVEFEDQKSCEQAYFKMDNVLIDDRRIHVDFSQSVSKYRWKGKGRLEVLEDGGKKKRNRDRGDDNRAKGDKPKMLYYPAKRAEEYEKGRRSPSPEKVRRRDRSRSREKRRRERSRSGERRKRSRSRSGERRRNRRSKSPEGDRDRRRRRSPPSSDDDERRRRRDKKRRSRSRSAERAQRRRRSRSASRERRRR